METIQRFGRSGITSKQYVIGRPETGVLKGTLNIGKYLALDGSTGSDVHIDSLKPHAILVCGKRGYGKSYTIGTLVEELSLIEPDIRENIAALVIDTMGIFWTMQHRNEKEKDILSDWSLVPQGFDADIFVPPGNVSQYEEMGIKVKPFSIPVSDLTGHDWCSLFGISPVSPSGILIVKIIDEMKEIQRTFSLNDIMDIIEKDTGIEPAIAARNYFHTAGSWGIFDEKGVNISDIIKGGCTGILDLSSLDDQNIRSIVIKILSKKIYNERIKARRSYEIKKMGGISSEKGLSMVWMFIDEAHMFLPRDNETPASGVLVNEWLRQGRQPGLSIVLATQRPSALHTDVISQSDIIICHRLTAQADIAALETIRPTYMREMIGDSLKKMGTEKGTALIVDDISEESHIVKIRPRKSWHGGAEPSALDE